MKKDIHPTYFADAKVICSCGNTFTTGSTKQNITVEVCSKCHPFYTGEHRYLDTKGRVDAFQKKQQLAKKMKETRGTKRVKEREIKQPKTLRELLGEGQ